MRKVEDRFFNDAAFSHLVTSLERLIEDLHLTPDEVREAAVYACIRVQMRHPRSFLVDPRLQEAFEMIHIRDKQVRP